MANLPMCRRASNPPLQISGFLSAVGLDEEGESSASPNQDRLSRLHRDPTARHLCPPELAPHPDVAGRRERLHGLASEALHGIRAAGAVPIIGAPHEREQDHVLEHPAYDETPKEPRRKIHPWSNQKEGEDDQGLGRELKEGIPCQESWRPG
jgi:hypothetical protein